MVGLSPYFARIRALSIQALVLCAGMLLLVACSGGYPAGRQEVQPLAAFARPSQYKLTSDAGVILRQGSEFEQELPHQNVDAVGLSALFTPDCPAPAYPWDGLAFALYSFDLSGYSGEETLYLDWDFTADYSAGWIGVANYSRDSWDWFGLPQSDQISFDFDTYKSADGVLLIALVFVETSPWQLAWLRCGTTQVSPGQWFHSWGDTGSEGGGAVAVDEAGNVYVGGTTTNAPMQDLAGLLLKLNSHGELQWARSLASELEDQVNDVCLDPQGNVCVTGLTYLADSGTSANVLLLKLDPDGNPVWQRSWGGTRRDWGQAVACDSDGNLYVCGRTDFEDALIMKYSADGELQWAKAWGGIQMDIFYGLFVDRSNDIYVTGSARSIGDLNEDVILLKISPEAEILLQRAWGHQWNDYGVDVVVDRSGDICVAGSFFLQSSGGFCDSLVIRCSPDGELRWASWWGTDGTDGTNCRLDSVGNPIISVYSLGESFAVSRLGKYQVSSQAWQFSPVVTHAWDAEGPFLCADFALFPDDTFAVAIDLQNALQGSWHPEYYEFAPVELEEYAADLPLNDALGDELPCALAIEDAEGVLDLGGGNQDVSVQAISYPWTN